MAQRGPGLRAHRVEIRKRVGGGNLAKQERVVEEGAEVIHRLDQKPCRPAAA